MLENPSLSRVLDFPQAFGKFRLSPSIRGLLMRSLGSECRYGFVLQLLFERPDLIRPRIGDNWAGVHPLFLPEKPEPERLLRSFSPSLLDRSSRFHFRMIREFQTNNFHVLLLA